MPSPQRSFLPGSTQHSRQSLLCVRRGNDNPFPLTLVLHARDFRILELGIPQFWCQIAIFRNSEKKIRRIPNSKYRLLKHEFWLFVGNSPIFSRKRNEIRVNIIIQCNYLLSISDITPCIIILPTFYLRQ